MVHHFLIAGALTFAPTNGSGLQLGAIALSIPLPAVAGAISRLRSERSSPKGRARDDHAAE